MIDDNELREALARIEEASANWPDIVVDGRQQFTAYKAETQMKLGKITPWEALMMCAHAGVPLPPGLVKALETAQSEYNDGKYADLAEPLGVAVSKQNKKHMAEKIARLKIAQAAADELIKGAYAGETSKPNETLAFETVSEKLGAGLDVAPAAGKFRAGIGPSTVRDCYYHSDSKELKEAVNVGKPKRSKK